MTTAVLIEFREESRNRVVNALYITAIEGLEGLTLIHLMSGTSVTVSEPYAKVMAEQR
jgi:hypothetical protein